MKGIGAILEEIGLTKNESVVYLSLVELGETTTGPLIKRTALHGSKVYASLERLVEKGLVSSVLQSKRHRYRAADPERIIGMIEAKREALDEQERLAREILPKLALKSKDEQPVVEVFEGWQGMETVYRMLRETLGKGDENLVFGASKGEDERAVQTFFNKHLSLLAQKRIKQRIIYNEEAKDNVQEQRKHPELFHIRYSLDVTPTEINIWSDRIMIVLLSKRPVVTVIRSKRVADSFRTYFERLWANADE